MSSCIASVVTSHPRRRAPAAYISELDCRSYDSVQPTSLQSTLSAMRRRDWGLAAERWYAVFLRDREAVEPCAMTARSLLHTRDADSASHVLDIGLERHPDAPELLEVKGDALVQLGYRRTAEDYYLRSLKQ